MRENYHIAIDTHIGGRPDNQDFAAKLETPIGDLILVCDGVGGGNGGGVASETAANVILDEFSNLSGQEEPVIVLNKAITKANQIVYTRSIQEKDLRGMATTVVALLLNPKHAIIAHVGDSRAYQIRGSKIIFRTRDHSKVQELIEEKKLTKEAARNHSQSHQITRAVGAKSTVQIDVQIKSYKKGDLFILTTDGIHDAMSEIDFLRTVRKQEVPPAIVRELVQISNRNGVANNNSKHDNMTLAAIKMDANPVGSIKYRLNLKKVAAVTLSLTLILVLMGLSISGFFSDKTGETTKDQITSRSGEQYFLTSDSLSNMCNRADSLLNRIKQSDSMDPVTFSKFKQAIDGAFLKEGICSDCSQCENIRDSVLASELNQTLRLLETSEYLKSSK